MFNSHPGTSKASAWSTPEFRSDLAYLPLTEQMLGRLSSYDYEETVPASTVLFSRGERQLDMFVVLEGEIAVSLPGPNGTSKVITHHHRLDFSGELNLLNSQGSLTEALTTVESRILRIPRPELQQLMRSEGEIANHITSSVIWRRIGIIGESMGGIELIGHPNDPETLKLQRFLIRNNYPHRMVEFLKILTNLRMKQHPCRQFSSPMIAFCTGLQSRNWPTILGSQRCQMLP